MGNQGNYYNGMGQRSISCIVQPVNGIGGIYLGDYDAANNVQLLQSLGIKAVLTAAIEANIHYDHSIVPYHFVINAQDTSAFNLIQYFDQAIDFTRKSLRSTNILIHCMVGVSRSATLTLAYFMAQKGMSYQNALTFVRQQRYIINPNPGFITQLKQYQNILSQRRNFNSRNSIAYAGSHIQSPISSYNQLPQLNQFQLSNVQQVYY